MTLLDTFFIDFKTQNLGNAENDVKKFDKQISDLAAKGNKRNKEEQEQLKLLRKQRLDATQDLKDQVRVTDSLGDSFGGLASKIIGVGAALYGLNNIKNGVLSSFDKNTSLENQSRVGRQSFDELRALSSAVQSEGGSAEGFLSLVDSMRRAANARGIPFTSVRALFDAANRDVQGKRPEEQARILETLYGVNDTATEVLLERQTDEYKKIIDLKMQSTHLTEDDRNTAKQFTSDLGDLDQAWQKFYAHIGTASFPVIEKILNSLNTFLTDVPKAMEFSRSSKTHAEFEQKMSDYHNGTISPKTGNSAIDFWLSQGYTLNGAIGMAAQEQAESGGNPNARNGRHYGLFQFDETRRKQIKDALGIDVADASVDEQRRAAAWDAHRRGDDVRINSGTNPGGSSAIANSYFEVSGESPENRIRIANQLANQYHGGGAGGNSGSGMNIKIDDITINTQATDAHGISQEFSKALRGHLDELYSDTNDGIGY